MKEVQFSIIIYASKEKVWDTLWDDVTFRDWANIIDEGTYMKGILKEGNEIQFISSINGYGVTSFIEKHNPNEFVLLRHAADTQDIGQQEREKEWTGGTESYSLTEKNGVTVLIVKIDIPREQEETFSIRIPKALDRVKKLAETIVLSDLKNMNIGQPAKRALEESGIHSLLQLCVYTEKELLAIHGIGPKAVRILKEHLLKDGLQLKE